MSRSRSRTQFRSLRGAIDAICASMSCARRNCFRVAASWSDIVWQASITVLEDGAEVLVEFVDVTVVAVVVVAPEVSSKFPEFEGFSAFEKITMFFAIIADYEWPNCASTHGHKNAYALRAPVYCNSSRPNGRSGLCVSYDWYGFCSRSAVVKSQLLRPQSGTPYECDRSPQ